jgi:putative ABC transport system substrate-binding protein
MERKLALTSSVLLLALLAFAEAEPQVKVRKIGYLHASSDTDMRVAQQREAFRQGLRERGYHEGRDVVIEFRYAAGNIERFPDLTTELVKLKVDVIIAPGTRATFAAAQVTKTIPIIMVAVSDPVSSGFVASLARPGGNVTGMSNVSPELSGKRLELLKETLPRLSRIAVFSDRSGPVDIQQTDRIAKTLGVQAQFVEIDRSVDFERVLTEISAKRPEALRVLRGPLTSAYQARILKFATKNQLPAMYDDSQFVSAGGLMSYGPDILDLYRRAAYYVDKILKGAKPADLPVEQPTKFELVINLKTAKQIGLTIPPNVLARADKVIK